MSNATFMMNAFFTVLLFFVAAVLFFAIVYRHIKRNTPKKTGIYKDAAELYERIKYASHPVELVFVTNDIMDFYNDHNGEKECREIYMDMMKTAAQKDVLLKQRRLLAV